jgi:hypothetical protein
MREWLAQLRTKIQALIFGFDFFVSYRHADGDKFARSLSSQLEKRGFDCFLDAKHYEAGGNLPRMQARALRRSSKLLVVVSPKAHASSTQGTDWLLAEIQEFKWVNRHKTFGPVLVPIGSEATFDAERFPDSKLLPELPIPKGDNICIFDPACERNGEVSPLTIDKLENDFTQHRTRTNRLAFVWGAAVLSVALVVLAVVADMRATAQQRNVELREAFRLLERGKEELATGNLKDAQLHFEQSTRRFRGLGRDPLLAVHHAFAVDLRSINISKIADVEGEVSYIRVSNDGDLILVVYDYQAPNGSPDLESIPDRPAVGVFQTSSRKWILKHSVGSKLGAQVYGLSSSEVVGFQAPHELILSTSNPGSFERLSLADGRRTPIDTSLGNAFAESIERSESTVPDSHRSAKWLHDLTSPDKLFRVKPEEGIDVEYGPRLVDQLLVTSPDHRTAVVGTYEGRLLLIDLEAALVRGEKEVEPVYAATYRKDGLQAFVADKSHLWQVDTSGWKTVREMPVSLRAKPEEPFLGETLLAMALSDDATVVSVVTKQRLLCRVINHDQWIEWDLPEPIENVGGLRIDTARQKIHMVVGDNGTLLTAHYQSPRSPLMIVPSKTDNDPAVAWFEAHSPMVWVTGKRTVNRLAKVHGFAPPGQSVPPVDLPIQLPDRDAEHRFQAAEKLHSIAKIGNSILLFYGDADEFGNHELRDEELITIPIHSPAKSSSVKVFKSTHFVDNLGEQHWSATHVREVLPSSTAERIYILTDRSGDREITELDSKPTHLYTGGLFSSTHADGDERYDLNLSATKTNAWLAIRHRGTGTSLKYELPWAFEHEAKFAAIAPGGRQLAIANLTGKVLFIDLSR